MAKRNKKEEVFELSAYQASDDWLRAGRLRKKAAQGDLEAAKELKEMESYKMIRMTRKEVLGL